MNDIHMFLEQLKSEGATTPLAFKLKRFLAECSTDLPADWPTLKVTVLSQHTATSITDAIRCACVLEGFIPEINEPQAGTIWQQLLDPASATLTSEADLVLIAPSLDSFEPYKNSDPVDGFAQPSVTRLYDGCRTLVEKLDCAVITQNFVAPTGVGLGFLEHQIPGSAINITSALNAQLQSDIPANTLVMDVDRLAANVGRRHWNNVSLHTLADMAFDPRHLPDYTNLLRAHLRASLGRIRKCLVTDLDNTLWRGIIGDDGVEGIEIGNDTPIGRGHMNFCNYLMELRERGIILAVCSKNDPEIARRAFANPNMPLKLEDFAAFECSWQDKATGLRNIARTLNIGTDSFVFVDDNPVERLLISQQLPEVQVIDLPEDAARYREAVDSAMPFVTARITSTDNTRAASYRALEQAKDLKAQSTDLESYLRSLAMRAIVAPVADADQNRVVQMEQRTNQFNLTTRRYSEADWTRFRTDPARHGFAITLADRFTNYGVISTILVKQEDTTMTIESWLMSCRAFSRGVEQYIFNFVSDFATGLSCDQIVGLYEATEKNKVVENLYRELGFEETAASNGVHKWTCALPAKHQRCFIDAAETFDAGAST